MMGDVTTLSLVISIFAIPVVYIIRWMGIARDGTSARWLTAIVSLLLAFVVVAQSGQLPALPVVTAGGDPLVVVGSYLDLVGVVLGSLVIVFKSATGIYDLMQKELQKRWGGDAVTEIGSEEFEPPF